MAKIIWLYSRKELAPDIEIKIGSICRKISPDNIPMIQPFISADKNWACGIMNPSNTFLICGHSILMGKMVGTFPNWDTPHSDRPDGSFALFRDSEATCELMTDALGSRTIWFYKDEEIFIASTSQRAIILFIGGFEFDRRVIPWMLSTGSLGPEASWDRRISRLEPDTSVILKKSDWTIQLNSTPIDFKVRQDSDRNHEDRVKSALYNTFRSADVNFSDWVLPLSGGFDSRGILSFLNLTTDIHDLRTITWGLESSLTEKKNDAYVAHKLAREFNVTHKYLTTDLSNEPIDKIIDRFIFNGDGRIDHISGYMDGFEIWKLLHKDGIKGIIRGDEGFGWNKASSALEVRQSVGLNLCSDYNNLRRFAEEQLPSQQLPGNLEIKDGETLDSWRDRLYHTFRVPVILAALSDLKLGYVEIFNPLLAKNILEVVRTLPDHLRTEKALFKKIVISVSPEVTFATRGANAVSSDLLKLKPVVDLLKKVLISEDANKLFPEEFLRIIAEQLKVIDDSKLKKEHSLSPKSFLFGMLPTAIKNLIKTKVPINKLIDNNVLAFRVYIIIRMHQILRTGN